MEILHLTDLHVTQAEHHASFSDEKLLTEWAPAGEKLVGRSFDFVLVSGDLVTGDGKRCPRGQEYAELSEFASKVLLKLLKIAEPHRIVFAPGNHDVNWQAVGDEVTPTADELEHYRESPADAPIRLHVDDAGQLHVYRIAPASYPQRFQPVQEFLDGFYKDCPASDHFRPFQLLNPSVDGHWSAHVFPTEHVAFYAFNTCFHNDRYWRGATLPRDAVRAAAQHAKDHARGCQLVAMWHHGLQAERGHPDFLTVEELGYLFRNGFHIGVHGHTHQDQFRHMEDVLSVRFPVVATGSFAAGPQHRPDGYTNQLAVIYLYPSYLQVERFFRRPNSLWELAMQRPFPLRADEAPRQDPARAAVHARSIEIDERDGIACVSVRLEGLELDGELTLATPSVDNLDFDRYAHTDHNQLEVTRHDRPQRLTVSGRGRFAWLTWSYRVPNTFALSKADIELRERSIWDKRLGADVDWMAHTVRFQCAKLRLSLRVVRSLDEAAPRAAGERCFDESGGALYAFVSDDPSSDEDLEEKARSPLDRGPQRVAVEVSAPMERRRYVMTYRPSGGAVPATASVRALVTAVADELRHSIDGGGASEKLNVAVETELKAIFGEPPHTWYAYLWHDQQRELVTSFGRFGRSSFANGFGCGSGVVGHAFRFCSPASYRRKPGLTSLIFEPSRSGARRFDWVVAVPLLVGTTGPAAGVLAFAGSDIIATLRGWERQLLAYADSASQTGPERSEWLLKLENQLIGAVTIPFWKTVAALPSTELATLYSEEAGIIRDTWLSVIEGTRQKGG